VGVRVADVPLASLHPEEARQAVTYADARKRTFAAGRAAMRLALGERGATCGPILSDVRGAPTLPAGVSGSISHKETVAVALVDDVGPWRVGVDVEVERTQKIDISRRVLTDDELEQLSGLEPPARARLVLTRFSLKEAIYKAIDPFLRRYVGFREVSIDRGGAVTSAFRPEEPALEIEATLREEETPAGRLFLSTARARLASR